MNELIKFVVTEAIDAVRLTTKSEQAMYTMMTVSVAQFFNTALMLLLQRNSLSCSWYAKSGDTIVETMYLQAYVPVVEFFSSFLVIKLVRLIDRGWSSDVDKTRLPTVDLYLQVHSGPNFDVEGVLEHAASDQHCPILRNRYADLVSNCGARIDFPIRH